MVRQRVLGGICDRIIHQRFEGGIWDMVIALGDVCFVSEGQFPTLLSENYPGSSRRGKSWDRSWCSKGRIQVGQRGLHLQVVLEMPRGARADVRP